MQEILVKVQTESKKVLVVEKSGKLHVSVTQKAQAGQANDAVIDAIATYMNVPRKNVIIVRGHTLPNKTVRVY
jgi:uncharacterized protein YggU (UPF0235/DUF167 family)